MNVVYSNDFEVFARQVAGHLLDKNWYIETIEPSQCQSCNYPLGPDFRYCCNCGRRVEDIPCSTSLHDLTSALKEALVNLGLVVCHEDDTV